MQEMSLQEQTHDEILPDGQDETMAQQHELLTEELGSIDEERETDIRPLPEQSAGKKTHSKSSAKKKKKSKDEEKTNNEPTDDDSSEQDEREEVTDETQHEDETVAASPPEEAIADNSTAETLLPSTSSAVLSAPEPESEPPFYRTAEILLAQPGQHKQYGVTLLTEDDLHYFNEGSHYRLYNKLGSRPITVDGVDGTYFAVWAPNAVSVFVMGDFNGWSRESHPLYPKGASGIWENFIPGIGHGDVYKYFIVSRYNDYRVEKADPFGFHHEVSPKTATVIWNLDYTWNDEEWMKTRKERNQLDAPISVYEVHLGSWVRVPEEGHRFMSYREIAPKLAEYVKEMGFTHVEFLPIMEHPFYGSWGYQVTGFFAPTSRYGTPQDFMFLVDTLHQHGIGVILDWVPSHFPVDQHGLGVFDGTHLYEHTYPQKGWHPDWNSYIFNYGRHEVRSFLMSSAFYWLDTYHIDGLRVDAVASMLYLDYSRREGEWMPNEYGGKENIEAIDFLRRFNEDIFKNYPDVQTTAEESTDWSMVSRPTYVGGLGFSMKWDMGWMHDTLTYIAHDPVYRKYHHNEMTFRMIYAFTENFTLPLSHDEVVHGKGSLLSKMPGDLWQKFSNVRLLFGYMFAQPGKKLLFMGGEIGQWREWYHEESLDWHLLEFAPHAGLQQWVKDLNALYCHEPALYERDCDPQGFQWIDCHDWEQSMFSMIRTGKTNDSAIVAICNFTPVPRYSYRVGVPFETFWTEVLNSDAVEYEGSGQGNLGGVKAEGVPSHGYPQSINVNVPPLGIVFFKGTKPDCEDS